MLRQITIVGVGLIGGSLALAMRRAGFAGRIVGCDSPAVIERAKATHVIDEGMAIPTDAILGSQVIALAAPVGAIVDMIRQVGGRSMSQALLTDVGSTKVEIMKTAREVMGKDVAKRFLAAHPMAGKENGGLENADATLFENALWLVTPFEGQDVRKGACGEWAGWIEKMGGRVAMMDAEQHDHLCAWVSHLPQMISTALAAALVDEFGEDAPLLSAGGRALREMTRIAGSPYSMWRDIALTNKKNLGDALLQLEQRLAHIRENLDSRELEAEFEKAHHLKRN